MKRIRKKQIRLLAILIVIIVSAVSYWIANSKDKRIPPDADCYVDFIDCGQGDSILVVSEGETTLIDATTGRSEENILDHLKERGIERIDHFILSHPHEDHIGGADVILDEFEVGNIYMKRPTAGTEPTSSVYISLLKQIKSLGKTVHAVEIGDVITCGAVTFSVLGPLEDYEDLNDQSVVLRGEIGEISFLFTGDQESAAEKDLVKEYGKSLQSTILKMGHHGSSGSSSDRFLDAVQPKYAIISCGKDNSYGHPHKEAIERLEERGISYYRTDLQGTITVKTDGKIIEVTEGN